MLVAAPGLAALRRRRPPPDLDMMYIQVYCLCLWDETKSEANYRVRGFDFEFATLADRSGPAMARRLRKTTRPSRGKARLARLRKADDRTIARTAPEELPILPADFWARARLEVPVPKKAISLRVDEDVLAWFKAAGPRYQSRMNAVLRSYMTHAMSDTDRVR